MKNIPTLGNLVKRAFWACFFCPKVKGFCKGFPFRWYNAMQPSEGWISIESGISDLFEENGGRDGSQPDSKILHPAQISKCRKTSKDCRTKSFFGSGSGKSYLRSGKPRKNSRRMALCDLPTCHLSFPTQPSSFSIPILKSHFQLNFHPFLFLKSVHSWLSKVWQGLVCLDK